MDELISKRTTIAEIQKQMTKCPSSYLWGLDKAVVTAGKVPAADAVRIKTLEKWLHEIATNNFEQPVTDMETACELIISRLDGLRRFARERD